MSLSRSLRVALGAAWIVACGSTAPDADPSDDTRPSQSNVSTTSTWVPIDTAYYSVNYVGEALISDITWTGTESSRFVALPTGTVMCEYTFDASGTPYDGTEACQDPDGNACRFAFDVSLFVGAITDGDLCTDFNYAGSTEGGSYSYGFTDDYVMGGNSYGQTLMFLYSDGWFSIYGSAAFNEEASTLNYDWSWGYGTYAL